MSGFGRTAPVEFNQPVVTLGTAHSSDVLFGAKWERGVAVCEARKIPASQCSKSPSRMTANVRPDGITSGMNFGKDIHRRTEKTFVFDTCDHAFNDAVTMTNLTAILHQHGFETLAACKLGMICQTYNY